MLKEHAGRYASSVARARAVMASEGVTALYRGFGATCARNTTFNGVYFGLIFAGQRALPPRDGAADIAQNLALGAAAGAAATLLKAPFDVVKSRIQAQLPDAAGKLRYRHTWQACALVAREAALWALGPCCCAARWGSRFLMPPSTPRSPPWARRAPRGRRRPPPQPPSRPERAGGTAIYGTFSLAAHEETTAMTCRD